MSCSTILVIDDSTTIRRLANNTLTSAGYHVVLAENAEVGVRLAKLEDPDLILLDHQLPGTTGVAVCAQLLQDDELKSIPVILSSTLRKQAYIEYSDCSNVIDMLPKPYNEELLRSTIEHALATGHMIVDSQAMGTAVPEVINQVDGSELAGDFKTFGLREVVDFLNNGLKAGVLEIESTNCRFWFYLDKGRIQAVTANGVDSSIVTESLPETLSNLAPVLKLAITGRDGSELQGLVQLLNNKVLDPRLLRKLLRHQAAMLTFSCLRNSNLREFRFESFSSLPPLFRDLPLDISLAALLVDGSLHGPLEALPQNAEKLQWVRRSIRGQNLDRAGMSARHQRIVGVLAQPYSIAQISKTLGWDETETLRVVYGLSLVDLLEMKTKSVVPNVLLFEPDNESAQQLRNTVVGQDRYQVRIVKDRLSIQLIMKRESPDFLVLPKPSCEEDYRFIEQLTTKYGADSDSLMIVYVSRDAEPVGENCLRHGFTCDELRTFLDSKCRDEVACSVVS